MNTEFATYMEHTMKRFNKTWDQGSFEFTSLNDDLRLHDHILEVELDPMRTRKRIKTPLLCQSTGDIHRGNLATKESRKLGACNRCLLRFPCIMVTICLLLGLFVLGYLIFIVPSCGILLQGPHCILYHPKQPPSTAQFLV